MGITGENAIKFHPDGTPGFFPGITTVYHLEHTESQCGIYDACVKHCFRIQGSVFTKYARLPEESAHVTTLNVTTYDEANNDEKWSEDEQKQRRADDMAKFLPAFRRIKPDLQVLLPIKMKVNLDPERQAKNSKPIGVQVDPNDEHEAQKFQSLRDKLSAAFEIGPADPSFGFHITVFYPLETLSKEQFDHLSERWSQAVQNVAREVETFQIKEVQLCTFDDMCHFEIQDRVAVG